MNQEQTNPEEPQLTREELAHLLRDGEPPMTRRELRQRDRAEEAGLLVRVDGRLAIAADQQGSASAEASTEPAPVTSADVLAGNVPAASGLTRRQLRELARQGAQEEQTEDTPVDAAPTRVSARRVSADLAASPKPAEPEKPAEQTARRPIVRPEGAQTGEYRGQFEPLRQAPTPIEPPSEPEAPTTPQAPERRSVFDNVDIDTPDFSAQELDSVFTDTNAADLTGVIDPPEVTGDFITDLAESEEPSPPENLFQVGTEPTDLAARGAAHSNLPDWQTLTSLEPTPASEPMQGGSSGTESEQKNPMESLRGAFQGAGAPLWLTVLQWLVIVVVAIVLGLLVWYAINKGFGPGTESAAGIIPDLYHLRI